MIHDEPFPLGSFAIALLIGALVGIEREKKLEEREARGEGVSDIGGLRTFILFAEAGAVAAWLALRLDALWLFLGGGVLVTAIVLAGYLAYTRAAAAHYGLTTEIAALIVYLLGGTVILGYEDVAVALAIATSAILAYKEPLHDVVERIGRDDLYAGLKLLIATFIVLPVLPDRAVDPWGVLNPWRMWWLVILISGLSLVGYIATRWLGPARGTSATAIFGGLASSTAVTLSFARRSRDESARGRAAEAIAGGILLSWAVMFVRIGVLVAAVRSPLLELLAPPLVVATLIAGGAAAAALWRAHRATTPREDVVLRNPFSLTAAMQFAGFFALVLLVVHFAETTLSQRGVYAVSALAGLTDVDAVTLSLAGRGEITATVAAIGICVAAAANTVVKCGICVALGSPGLRRPVILGTAVLLAGSALTLLLAP